MNLNIQRRSSITFTTYNKLNKPILGFILITVNYLLPDGTKIKQENVAQEISKLENVEEVNIVTGVTDILIKVRVSSIEALNDFIIKKLRNINGVDKTQTMITLSSY